MFQSVKLNCNKEGSPKQRRKLVFLHIKRKSEIAKNFTNPRKHGRSDGDERVMDIAAHLRFELINDMEIILPYYYAREVVLSFLFLASRIE